METFLNILPWALAILAGVLYYFSRQKAKRAEFLETHSTKLEKIVEEKQIRNIELTVAIDSLEEKVKNQGWLITNLRQAESDRDSQIAALEEERKNLNRLLEQAQEGQKHLLDDTKELQFFISEESASRFVNSAVINVYSITLKDIELIHENHIKVIRSLAAKGYFREDLANRFNYNPKNGNIQFDLLEFHDEFPIRAKDWKELLTERRKFIDTITQYIEGVIGQREINKAVEEAIEGSKEVVNA